MTLTTTVDGHPLIPTTSTDGWPLAVVPLRCFYQTLRIDDWKLREQIQPICNQHSWLDSTDGARAWSYKVKEKKSRNAQNFSTVLQPSVSPLRFPELERRYDARWLNTYFLFFIYEMFRQSNENFLHKWLGHCDWRTILRNRFSVRPWNVKQDQQSVKNAETRSLLPLLFEDGIDKGLFKNSGLQEPRPWTLLPITTPFEMQRQMMHGSINSMMHTIPRIQVEEVGAHAVSLPSEFVKLKLQGFAFER